MTNVPKVRGSNPTAYLKNYRIKNQHFSITFVCCLNIGLFFKPQIIMKSSIFLIGHNITCVTKALKSSKLRNFQSFCLNFIDKRLEVTLRFV